MEKLLTAQTWCMHDMCQYDRQCVRHAHLHARQVACGGMDVTVDVAAGIRHDVACGLMWQTCGIMWQTSQMMWQTLGMMSLGVLGL